LKWAIPRPINGTYNALGIPVDQVGAILLECWRNVIFGSSSCVNADNPLSQAIGLLDFPIYPWPSMRLFADQYNHGRCPRHFHAKESLDLIIAHHTFVQPALIRGLCTNRAIPYVITFSFQHSGHLRDMSVVLMVMADENVSSIRFG
jgi:hypothetical protein